MAQEDVQTTVQPEKERLVIEKALASMETKMLEAEKDIAKIERRTIIQAVYQEAKTIQGFELTTEQAERFRKVMYGNAMDMYMHTCGPETHRRMEQMQSVADRKMLMAIEKEVEQTTDTDKLQGFLRFIMNQKDQKGFLKDKLASTIHRKLTKAREQQAIYKIYNEVPPEVEEIVESLARGEIDVEQTRERIVALASKNVAENPSKNRFALNQGQQERQIRMQIRNTLSRQAERFPIVRPERTLRLLQAIGGQEEYLNLRAVIENQIGRKQFLEAKALCGIYEKTEDDIARRNVNDMRRSIRNAELGDLILRGIQGQVTPEGAAQFWKTLESGIQRGNVTMSQVIIGKTEDGTRDITLEDIWPESQKQRNK